VRLLGGDLRLLHTEDYGVELGVMRGSIGTRRGSCESEHTGRRFLVW
jgi:hypothetical protein